MCFLSESLAVYSCTIASASSREGNASVNGFLRFLACFNDVAVGEENSLQRLPKVGNLSHDELETDSAMLERFLLCVLHDRFCLPVLLDRNALLIPVHRLA